MTNLFQSTQLATQFRTARTAKWLVVAGFIAAFAGLSHPADAKTASYDGVWNVVFATKAGNCSATNSVPFTVTGARVSSAGGGKVTGGIRRNGAVAVKISVGLSWANGTGRLAGNSGTGQWAGVISGDQCSGSWQAIRN